MVLLDTNVISELVRSEPDAAVARFFRAQLPQSVFTSAVCEAEIRYGLAKLPAGRRRNDLRARIAAFFKEAFQEEILPFDSVCTEFYGAIRA